MACSTDANGLQKFYIWQKNDGTCEIGGNDDNMVRYSKLETAYNIIQDKLNDLITKYNTHVHVGVTTGSGSSGTTTSTETASNGDITPAKITRIKTISSDS